VGSCGLDTSGSEQRLGPGCCEHGNEHMSSIKGGKSRLAKQLLASQERLCSIELVNYEH
jgi:hypothetical protein